MALSISATVMGLFRLDGGSRKAGRVGSSASLNSASKYSLMILAFSSLVPAMFPAELWTVRAGLTYPFASILEAPKYLRRVCQHCGC